jgi:hypothetical protein
MKAKAPPRRRKGRAPNGDPGLFSSTPPSVDTKVTTKSESFDFDQRVVAQVDWSIWRAIFAGEFRLAVQCDMCGRWLTAGASKRAHRGPRCAAKAAP